MNADSLPSVQRSGRMARTRVPAKALLMTHASWQLVYRAGFDHAPCQRPSSAYHSRAAREDAVAKSESNQLRTPSNCKPDSCTGCVVKQVCRNILQQRTCSSAQQQKRADAISTASRAALVSTVSWPGTSRLLLSPHQNTALHSVPPRLLAGGIGLHSRHRALPRRWVYHLPVIPRACHARLPDGDAARLIHKVAAAPHQPRNVTRRRCRPRRVRRWRC